MELPVRVVEIPVDEKLLELALKHNLALYDASYLSLALLRSLPIARGDGKPKEAAESAHRDYNDVHDTPAIYPLGRSAHGRGPNCKSLTQQ